MVWTIEYRVSSILKSIPGVIELWFLISSNRVDLLTVLLLIPVGLSNDVVASALSCHLPFACKSSRPEAPGICLENVS